MIGELPVRNRDLAQQAAQQRLLLRIGGGFDQSLQNSIHHAVDAADEEAGHARDMAGIAARSDVRLHTGDVCFRHPLINLLRKQQRDVDIDAFADQLLKGRNTLGSAGHLDHQVRTIHCAPQPTGIAYGSFGVMRQERRDLQADVAIALTGAVVHGPQCIGGVLNVFDREDFINARGVQVLTLLQLEQGIGVIGAAGDGLLENRGIGGNAAQPVLFDQPLELAAGDEIAANVIQPDGLPILVKVL